VRPEFPADPKHAVTEPALELIAQKLRRHGIPGEPELWQAALKKAGAVRYHK